MDRKTVAPESAQFKLDESGNGSFTGYGAVFGNEDRGGDVIERGAFAKTIPSFLRDGFIALGHDWHGAPIAYPVSAIEDDYGLLITAEFHSTDEAQEVRTMVRERLAAGKSVGLSIGYSCMDGVVEYDNNAGVRRIKECELFETSIVSVPMNALARATSAKADGDPPGGLRLEDEYEQVRVATLGYLDRVREIAAKRLAEGKEGRVMSGANRERVTQMRDMHSEMSAHHEEMGARCKAMADMCQELLDQSEPKPKGVDPADVRALEAELLALELRALAREGAI